MKNTKKTIFITGASSGIGRETAKILAEKGHKVFAGIRRKSDKDELSKLNKNIIPVYIDVESSPSIEKALAFIVKNTDSINVLINNAGIAIGGPLEFIPIDLIKKQFNVNTFGAVEVAQKFIPYLKHGKIINISSMAATGLFPYISPYGASKSALDILFYSLMQENKDNIKVVSVRPAVIKTPIWTKSVNTAKHYFNNLNDTDKNKYIKELYYLEKNALTNSDKGIDVKKAADKIVSIVNAKNPKSLYYIGIESYFAHLLLYLPKPIVNFLIKNKLNCI